MFPNEFSALRRRTFADYRRTHTPADCEFFADDLYNYSTPDEMLVISAIEDAADYDPQAWSWRLLLPFDGSLCEVVPAAFGYESAEAAFEHARAVYLYLTGARAEGNYNPALEEMYTCFAL